MSASIKIPKAVRERSNLFVLFWTVPALVFYVAFAIIPLFIAVYLSFTNWNGLAPAVWIGLGNWIALFSDAVTGNSLLLTIEVMVISWVVQTPLSILLGVFMAGKQRYRAIFSVLYFLPLLFSAVAIALTWQTMLDPNFGVLDTLLDSMGLHALSRAWLGDPSLAFYVVMVIISWEFIPFHALLYLGGARQIPKELYEAANIDGSGSVQNFFRITLPQLKYTVITSTTLIFTGSLTYFDLFWVTTQGGPGYATRVLPLQMYITAFQNEQVGYGSMIAVVLAAFGLLLSFILLRFTGFSKMSSQLEGL
jgi:raffinose/stachyose/melibiose transport system permease protein